MLMTLRMMEKTKYAAMVKTMLASVHLTAEWMWEMKRRENKVRSRPRIGIRIQGKLRQGL